MGLTNHTWPTLHHIMPLVMASGADTQTHTHTDMRLKKPGVRSLWPHVSGLKVDRRIQN